MTDFGTYYIQAVAFVISKWAYLMHFEDLMTRVNALVSKAEARPLGGKTFKQVSKKESSLRKQLFFFPGLP